MAVRPVDSDQPGSPPSLTRGFAVCSMANDPSFLHTDSEDYDQTEVSLGVGSHMVSVRIHCKEKCPTSFHNDVLSKNK